MAIATFRSPIPASAEAAASGVEAPAGAKVLRVLTATWNAGNARPPSDLEPWLPKGGGDFDIIAVGLQECTFKNKSKKKVVAAPAGEVEGAPGGSGAAAAPEAPAAESGSGAAAEDGDDDAGAAAADAEGGDEDDDSLLAKPAPVADEAINLEELELAIRGAKQRRNSVHARMEVRAASPLAAAGGGAAPAAAPAPDAGAAGAAAAPGITSGTVTFRVLNAVKSMPATVSTCVAFDVIKAHIGEGFTCVSSMLLWQTGLLLFVRAPLVPEVDEIQTGCEATGLMGVTPNKGGVAIKVRVFKHTTLVFVSSHLAAHMHHAKHRDLNFNEIINAVRLGSPELDMDSQFSHAFWVGDLNYRVDLAIVKGGVLGKETPEAWEAVHSLVVARDYPRLWAADQLRASQRRGTAFVGWQEQDPAFYPTFKVVRGPGCEHLKQRVPSYTDRVLWKSLPALARDVAPLAYSAHASIATSDHKPVSAAFAITCRAPAPTAAPVPPGSSVSRTPVSGPIVRLGGLRGKGLVGMDVSGKSDPYVLFYADRPIHSAVTETGLAPRTSVLRQTTNPVWADKAIDEFRVAADTPADLHSAHLFLVVMDWDLSDGDDLMGQAILALGPVAAANGAPVPFTLPITRGGRQEGTLEGAISIAWPHTTVGAASRKLRTRTERCCEIM